MHNYYYYSGFIAPIYFYCTLFQGIFETCSVFVRLFEVGQTAKYSNEKVIKHFIKKNKTKNTTTSEFCPVLSRCRPDPWIQLLTAEVYQEENNNNTHVHVQTDTTMFDYFYIFVHTLILEMCCIWDCWRHSSPNSCVSHDFHYNDNLPLCLERWMSPLPRWVCLARCDWLLVLVSGLIIVKHTDFTLNTFHYEHGNTRFRSTGICSFTLLHLSVCLEWCV